ncbi:DUF3027 domain-containing protein [Labedella endophytica]|uniref:DUF3027 domain-containing protein n=1 Tax=Labedella endophytica TaxID=1523160 RepID=A0A433JQ66_9MICO|nr:DUF3027 domain-containing protein [Labedella endophytica]RUQ99038.1 DUF3027 domain-containing protein [Labedella endophytica]
MPERDESTDTGDLAVPLIDDAHVEEAAETREAPETDEVHEVHEEPLASDSSAGGAPADESSDEATTEIVFEADEVLVASRSLARSALLEVTPERTIGADAGHTVEAEHVLTLRFSSRVDGYVGWFWVVTIARVEDEAPTVLEISMMPGEGSLTAPDWVPWSDRLADHRASEEAADATSADADDDADDDIDEADLDEDDDDLDIDAVVADSDDDDDADDDDDDDESDDDDDDESDDSDDDDDDSESDDDESDDEDDADDR